MNFELLDYEDGKYPTISDFVYKDNIYTESQYKYGANSVVILTGEIYGNILGINIDNTGNTFNKYIEVCEKYNFRGKSITMITINRGYHLYLRPNERQTIGLRNRDLSKIKLFDVDIDARYDGQYMNGPTIIDYNGDIFRCQILMNTNIHGVAPLPDFMYDEIIRQLNKGSETSLNEKEFQIDQQINHIVEFKQHVNENVDDFIKNTNFNKIKDKEHMMIQFCKSYLKNNIDKIKVLSTDSVKMYCETFLIFTRKKKDKIKGTKLSQRCAEHLGDVSLLPQMMYPFFDENGLSYKTHDHARCFIYVKFRNPLDNK